MAHAYMFESDLVKVIIGVITVTLTAIISYLVLYKKFNLSKELSMLIPFSIAFPILFLFSLIHNENPPYFLFALALTLMARLLYRVNKQKSLKKNSTNKSE